MPACVCLHVRSCVSSNSRSCACNMCAICLVHTHRSALSTVTGMALYIEVYFVRQPEFARCVRCASVYAPFRRTFRRDAGQ